MNLKDCKRPAGLIVRIQLMTEAIKHLRPYQLEAGIAILESVYFKKGLAETIKAIITDIGVPLGVSLISKKL